MSCIATLYTTLRAELDPDDVRAILRWLGRFARYPIGADDAGGASSLASSGQLSPLQKAVLSFMAQLAPLPCSEAWPDALDILCTTLCPFKVALFRRSAASSPEVDSGVSSAPTAVSEEAGDDPAVEARSLTSAWMVRAADQLASWFKDHVPWQVRISMFTAVVSCLSECMATRHMATTLGGGAADPAATDLWRTAARAFVSVVQSGLPSVNITAQSQQQLQQQGQALQSVPLQQQPHQQRTSDPWPMLARAFEMFLLGQGLPATTLAPGAVQSGPSAAAALVATPSSTIDFEVQAAVLDCLSDTVLTACQYASNETRRVDRHSDHNFSSDPPPLSSGWP